MKHKPSDQVPADNATAKNQPKSTDEIIDGLPSRNISNSTRDTYYYGKIKNKLPIFYEQTLPELRLNTEWRLAIDNFLAGTSSPLIDMALNGPHILHDIIEKINKCIDDDKKVDLLLELLYKYNSYVPAVNKQREFVRKEGVPLISESNDPVMELAVSQLSEIFNEELLAKSLTSEIQYYPDTVAIRHSYDHKELTRAAFSELIDNLSAEDAHILISKKIRALTCSVFNQDSVEYQPLPILLFAFTSSDWHNVDHLNGLSEGEQEYRLKLGAISHEIAHSLFNYTLTRNDYDEWEVVASQYPPFTEYARKYESGVHAQQRDFNEEFAEAIRLAVTAPAYFEEHFPLAKDFVQRHFPQIKPPSQILQPL